VLATGASIGDGTTTTMLQLAQALVTSGRSVLLIDGDSRTGDMTRRLGLERQASGLAELLADEATLSECVVGARALAELQVLPAGRRQWPGPLVGVRLREIVDQARELADHVLVDTAPLGQASDLVPALAEVDEVLVIARPGHTRRADFTLLRDVLDASGTTAVNMVVVGERSWQRQLPIAAARALDETAHPRPKATAPGADSRSGEIRRSDS
jgi:Mrp family chromosome partitioning ATPase